ncbi:MAG: Gldg family protein [Opitutaceae bacterium]
MKLSGKAISIVLLFIGLVLVNYLAANLPARLDTTAERIYTLSSGTQALLVKVEEPITLDFYFTKSANGLPIAYKNYATRVEEMLRQYARASRGKITLNVIDPRPDTPEEERATAARIQPQLIPATGEQIQFGIVATQADQQKTLSALNPQREQFLEYDLSQLVYSVQQIDKKKLGLLTSLPLQGTSQQEAQMMMMMRQQPQPGQFVTTEWEKTFQIIRIEPTASELPAGLDALAVIHPQNLTTKLQFAIDQFILDGRPVFLAVDPSSQYFKRQNNPQQSMMGGQPSNVSSDLAPLLSTYGINYDPQKIVGDLENATQVQTQGGQLARYPVWLSLRRGNFNATSAPTGQLNSALFIEPGFLAPQVGATTTFTPLVESSAQSGDVAAMALQFSQPDAIARQITPTGKKTLAALITGKFKTAFPAGAPQDPDKKDSSPSTPPAATTRNLSESKTTSTLFVIADTDWLFDDYSIRKMNFFGQTAAEPFNDNLAFAANTLEFLSGSSDLISLRGKGNSVRPFEIVRTMEIEANKKYQEKLTALESRLQQVQTKLSELQGKKGEANKLVASPEITKAIGDFQKQQATLQSERREIRRALREDIDALENRLLLINLIASPLVIGAFGFWFARSRKNSN